MSKQTRTGGSRRVWLALALLLTAGLLAACNGGAQESVTVPELSETFSGTDLLGGTLTVQYPAGWSVEGDANSLRLASDADVLSGQGSVPAGEAAMGITVFAAGLTGTGDDQPTAASLLADFSTQLREQIPDLGEITETTIGEYPAARVSATTEEGDALVMVVNIEGAFAQVIASTAPGELEQQMPLIEAVLATVSYTSAGDE